MYTEITTNNVAKLLFPNKKQLSVYLILGYFRALELQNTACVFRLDQTNRVHGTSLAVILCPQC